MDNLGAIEGPGSRDCCAGLVVFCILAVLSGGPAFAAGPVEGTPQPTVIAPTIDWTGPYVGLSLLGSVSDGEAERTRATGAIIETDVDNGLFPAEIGNWQSDMSVGVSLGYNFQRDRFVSGVELNLANLNQDTRFSFSRIDPAILVGVETVSRFGTAIDGFGTLSYRGGYAMGDMLVYGSVGLARASVRNEYTLDLSDGGFPVLDFAEDGGRWGYTIGFGVEKRLDRRTSLHGELVYYDLEDVTVEARAPTLFPGNALDYTFANDGFVARIGFKIAF